MTGCRRLAPLIVRSVDGDLEPGEALRLARHIATCTSCRIVLAREARLAAMLYGMEDECSVDESFSRAVMASLPELSPHRRAADARKARWRSGLRLAGLSSIVALGAGLAARALPSLRLDVATPVMPRFTPDDTAGWISLIGWATQWIRMTAQSIAWAGSSGSIGSLTIGAMSISAALAGMVALLALSGAFAWAARARTRAS